MSDTLTDTESRRRYVATAGQTSFSVPFVFFENSDLKVYRQGSLLTYSASPANASQYSTTGGDGAAGTIVLGAPGATLSDDVLIYRDLPVALVADFPSTGPFDIDALNRVFVKMVAMIEQQEVQNARRTLRIAFTDLPETLSALPIAATRANQFLGFDADGQPEAVSTSAAMDAALAAALAAAEDAEAAMTAAIAAQVSAEAALAATLTAYDNFDDRYLGPKAADPTLDNDGNALVAGAIYFNTGAGEMRLWTGSAWVLAYFSGGSFLPLSGGTLSGPLTLSGNPSSPNHAANKTYVDLFAALAGATFTGKVIFPTAVAGFAPINIGQSSSVDPSSPVNGDIWLNNGNLSYRAQGTTARVMPKAGGTFTGIIVTEASATGASGFRLPHGVAPSAPTNGDTWTTTTAFQVRMNGATRDVAFLDSPTFTGTPIAPNSSIGLATTQIATTAFVDRAVSQYNSLNAQTGTTYTLVLGDGLNVLLTMSNAGAITCTVPPNSSVAFPIGTRIDWEQIGAGQVTFAQGAGVTINARNGLKAGGQYAGGTLIKRATDTWVLHGDTTT